MICFIRYDSGQLNSVGLPRITDIYVSGNIDNTSGYISTDLVSENPLNNVEQFSFLFPFSHSYAQGPFAWTGSGMVYFYNNRDVYFEYITDRYNAAVDTLTAGYSEQNQKSWNKKSELAFAYNAMSDGQKSGCISDPNYNMLVQEANARHITLDTLIIQLILPKAMYFENAHGNLTGKWAYLVSGVINFVGTDEDLNSYLSRLVIDFSF